MGKTTFAASAPGSVFIRTEDGLGNLEATAFPLAQSFEDVCEAVTAMLTEDHDHQWLVIDSLSALEPLIWASVAKAEGKRHLEELSYGKGYILALDAWRWLLDQLMQLATKRGVGSILLAHSEIVRYEAPDVDAYDRAQIKLHKRAFGLIYERADVIGYASPKVMVRKDQQAKGEAKRNLGIGTGQRELHLVERPAYIAKNRYSLPDTMALDWATFAEALTASVQPMAEAA
ncbi:MAG: ATP-binding protein [Myxococcales bacterium]|nr:ATP-binding protein [Myxococcales bacterium]